MSGLTVLDDFPTRRDSVLDNCLTNRKELFSSPSSIPALMRKDHYGVILPAGCKLKPVRSKVKFRDYRDHKKILFERKLQECDWSSVTDAQDVETASTFFYKIINNLMDECFPVKSVRLSSRDPPWMTPLVKHLMKRKFKA